MSQLKQYHELEYDPSQSASEPPLKKSSIIIKFFALKMNEPQLSISGTARWPVLLICSSQLIILIPVSKSSKIGSMIKDEVVPYQ